MKRLSVKRAKQEREYAKIREQFLAEFTVCQRCQWRYSTQVHHKKGRIGALLTDKDFFLAVCEECHEWIEKHPLEAKQKGYSLSRLSKV